MYNVPQVDDFFSYGVQSFEKQDSYFYKGVSVVSICTLIYLTFLFLKVNRFDCNKLIETNDNIEDKESV